MCIQRITATMLILIGGLQCDRAESQDVAAPSATGRLKHPWTNVFAGKQAHLDCLVSSPAAGDATLAWSVALEGGVITRGERTVTLVADRPGEVTIDVDFPELKPGVIAAATLRLEVRSKLGKSGHNSKLYVFSPDVVADREQWLKSLDIALFDPARKTQAAFTSSQIPYRITEGPDGAPVSKGLIIHGEGLEPARQKASWQAALAAAASGRRVIVMASSGATLPADSLFAANGQGPNNVSLRSCEVIRELDKRLDASEWPLAGHLVASSLHWTAKGATPLVELRNDAAGWPWLDMRYANGGRLVWTGMGLVESWEATPAARYLFVKLLEEVMVEKPETEGSRNVAQ